jgi:hypothetical protein
MKYNELYPSKYLKAADLEGRPQLVTIEQVKLEPVTEGEPPKPVLKLRGLNQGLVLNKTNGATIAGFLGDDTDKWVREKIVLFPDKAQFHGKLVDCIRVRQPKPQTNAATPIQERPCKTTEALPPATDSDDVMF